MSKASKRPAIESNVVRTELQRAVEEAERDLAENRWTEHSEVEAKLKWWASREDEVHRP